MPVAGVLKGHSQGIRRGSTALGAGQTEGVGFRKSCWMGCQEGLSREATSQGDLARSREIAGPDCCQQHRPRLTWLFQ